MWRLQLPLFDKCWDLSDVRSANILLEQRRARLGPGYLSHFVDNADLSYTPQVVGQLSWESHNIVLAYRHHLIWLVFILCYQLLFYLYGE